MREAPRRSPVSIVCVSNDADVLSDALARSVQTLRPTAPQTELIVLSNGDGEFATAGAALNHGVRAARHSVCVFVHQDVYLHSLVRLEEAAAALLDDAGIGLLGALGITGRGELRGRIRDRVMLLGRAVDGPTDVDSLDEVLFMARRDQLLDSPLSEAPELAWHAYAVEYGSRLRNAGRRVVAGRIPLTHNSLTTNLARLSEAHAHVGGLYPRQLPIRTTCGVIAANSATPSPMLARHRWRYRWLKGSHRAYRARRLVGRLPVVLSDIRMNIDSVLDDCDIESLTVASLRTGDGLDDDMSVPVELRRLGRRFTFCAADRDGLLQLVADRTDHESLLVTNLDRRFLAEVRAAQLTGEVTLGFALEIGFWLITGPASQARPSAWRQPSAIPLGLRAESGSRR